MNLRTPRVYNMVRTLIDYAILSIVVAICIGFAAIGAIVVARALGIY